MFRRITLHSILLILLLVSRVEAGSDKCVLDIRVSSQRIEFCPSDCAYSGRDINLFLSFLENGQVLKISKSGESKGKPLYFVMVENTHSVSLRISADSGNQVELRVNRGESQDLCTLDPGEEYRFGDPFWARVLFFGIFGFSVFTTLVWLFMHWMRPRPEEDLASFSEPEPEEPDA